MALAAGTGYLVNLIYYVSTGTLKMVDEIPVPCLMALTSPLGNDILPLEDFYFLTLFRAEDELWPRCTNL